MMYNNKKKTEERGRISRLQKYQTLAKTAGVFLCLVCLIFPFFLSFSTPVVHAKACGESPISSAPAGGAKEELLLASFTTHFDGDNVPRSHNIRLACLKLNGIKVGAGEEFSFNKSVGARTKENGFLDAVVIFEGQFVLGIGGGVCQVSTTLYNALLIAGMGITNVRSHTLQVGYVPPSQDAMVSTHCDLKFINPTSTPVVIYMHTQKNSVTARIYGKKSSRTYRVESEVLAELPPPPPTLVKGEKNATVRAAKNGLKSQSFLLCYHHGKLVERRLLRRDCYAYIQGVEERVETERNTDANVEMESVERGER